MSDDDRKWVVPYEEFVEVLYSSDALTVVVRGHLLIVRVLDALLSEALQSPHSLEIERMSAALKFDLVAALGLIDAESRRLGHYLGKVRNRFAHNSAANFTDEDAAELRSALSAKHREIVASIRDSQAGDALHFLRSVMVTLQIQLEGRVSHLREDHIRHQVLHEMVDERLARWPQPDASVFDELERRVLERKRGRHGP